MMPVGNPFGYVPQFTPSQAPQIPQLPMPQLNSNFQLPSLGSLIQPTQPGQGFDLMSAYQQGRSQIENARNLASVKPNIPPKPETPAPINNPRRGFTFKAKSDWKRGAHRDNR